jgi:hypothetical protein
MGLLERLWSCAASAAPRHWSNDARDRDDAAEPCVGLPDLLRCLPPNVLAPLLADGATRRALRSSSKTMRSAVDDATTQLGMCLDARLERSLDEAMAYVHRWGHRNHHNNPCTTPGATHALSKGSVRNKITQYSLNPLPPWGAQC